MNKTDAFKNWGTLNGHSSETREQFKEASQLHMEDMKANPDNHTITRTTPYRCYHVETCSCGFGYSCDSSD